MASKRKRSVEFDFGLHARFALPMKPAGPDWVENFFLGIKDARIAAARKFRSGDERLCRRFLQFKNAVILPGLINGHTHLPMTLLRGIEDDTALDSWLFQTVIPLENQMVRPDFVRAGTELAALECIRFGTTTVNDMYFFSETECEVWNRFGLRGIFSQVYSGFPTPEDRTLGRNFSERFRVLKNKYRGHERLQIGLGPHAPYTCDDAIFREVVDLASATDSKIHLHLSETRKEVEDSIDQFGISPVARLKDLGVLRPGTICAHSVHLNKQDIDLMRTTGASAVFNPDSNAKLASGVAPIPEFLKNGISVGLGTDGSVSKNDLSLFSAMNLGAKILKLFNSDPTAITARQMLHMATLGGAQALGIADQVGSLEVGKLADVIAVDLSFPHLQPVNNLLSQMVYSCQGLEVDSVFCHGRPLLLNKKFTNKESAGIFQNAERWRTRVSSELKKLKKRTAQ